MLHRLIILAAALVACGPTAVAPDAVVDATDIPRSPAGTFAVTSQLDLITIPAPAQAIVDELQAATDGPDDPARYLVDRVIAGLPDGTVKTIAADLAPFIAPYVEAKLAEVAPGFAPGIRALATGFAAAARHFGTIETFRIEPNGATTRTIVGLAFGAASLQFRDEGLADAVAMTTTDLDIEGGLAILDHRVALAYGSLLRLGLDRGVIPGVDLGVTDLASALRDLVDCQQLGTVVADRVGLGGARLFEAACDAGLSALATDVYDRIAAIDAATFELEVAGSARAIDVDYDGTMDVISAGTWTGTTHYLGAVGQLGAASFIGRK